MAIKRYDRKVLAAAAKMFVLEGIQRASETSQTEKMTLGKFLNGLSRVDMSRVESKARCPDEETWNSTRSLLSQKVQAGVDYVRWDFKTTLEAEAYCSENLNGTEEFNTLQELLTNVFKPRNYVAGLRLGCFEDETSKNLHGFDDNGAIADAAEKFLVRGIQLAAKNLSTDKLSRNSLFIGLSKVIMKDVSRVEPGKTFNRSCVADADWRFICGDFMETLFLRVKVKFLLDEDWSESLVWREVKSMKPDQYVKSLKIRSEGMDYLRFCAKQLVSSSSKYQNSTKFVPSKMEEFYSKRVNNGWKSRKDLSFIEEDFVKSILKHSTLFCSSEDYLPSVDQLRVVIVGTDVELYFNGLSYRLLQEKVLDFAAEKFLENGILNTGRTRGDISAQELVDGMKQVNVDELLKVKQPSGRTLPRSRCALDDFIKEDFMKATRKRFRCTDHKWHQKPTRELKWNKEWRRTWKRVWQKFNPDEYVTSLRIRLQRKFAQWQQLQITR